MLGFVNLEFPLNLDDMRFPSEEEAAEGWIHDIEQKMKSWEITDDKDKVAVCLRNLTGRLKTEADGRSWSTYDAFKAWLRKIVSLDGVKLDIENVLTKTVQTRSFREYEQKFRGVRAQNKQSAHPLTEQAVISYFLKNMRNIALQRILLKQMFTNYDSLVEFAEDLIRNGRVKERYPSSYPRPIKASQSLSSLSSKDHDSRDLFSGLITDSISIGDDEIFSESESESDNNEGWLKRMLHVLIDHPLDLNNRQYTLEADAVKAWLSVLELVIFMLDFRSNEEEVSFCLYNAKGIVADAALRRGAFLSFFEFRKWALNLYGIHDQKRDIVRSLMKTLQSGSLRRYIFQFRKLLVENEYCKYPVSPELIGEFFIENLRDDVLQLRLEQTRTNDLNKLISTTAKLLDAGDIPNFYPAWESQSPPFDNGNNPSKQSKRSRLDTTPRQSRNVRVKTEPPFPPLELSTGMIELTGRRSPHVGRANGLRDMSLDFRHLSSPYTDRYSSFPKR